MESYDLKKFIDEFLIPDLGKMIDHQLHYYAFSIICQAIEVMGSVYDQKDFNDYGLSEGRFSNALKNLFDKKYREKQDLFYSVLRGPLIHQLRPGEGLWISSEKKDNIKRENHLQRHEQSGKVILVIEPFFDDFVDAYKRFCAELEKRNDLHSAKVSTPFIYVTSIDPPFPTKWWDESTESVLTATPSITSSAAPAPRWEAQQDKG